MATKFEVVLTAKLDESSVRDIQKQINSIVKNQDISIKADNKQVNSLTKSLQSLGEEAKNAKGHTQGLSDIVSKFSSWQVVGDVIHGVKDAMSDMVQQVFDLDESLTELDKVTDLTSSGLQSLADDAFSVGQQIGATGKDVIDATTLFAQAGYEAQDALDLGEQAIMLKNVSEAGATAEGSASTLIAAMKAFGLEADSSSHIVDALNEVSNKYAVSVNDLSTAISKSSASMAAGNNTLEETFGLVTAGTEILREPGRVANGLSTITARLTAENDEYIKSITGGMGVIDDQTGELRSTFDILQDLSEAWEGLTSVEKQELAETVAGKTQRSLFTAIMTNFESAVGATEAALNSEGSAAAENAKRMESLQGKVQQLESAWQNFSRNSINSDFIKNILSATTALINFMDSIGGLPTLLMAAVSALMLFKGGLILDKIFKAFSSGIGIVKKSITDLTGILSNAATGFKTFSAGITTLGIAIEAAVPVLAVISLAITAVSAAIDFWMSKEEEAREKAAEMAEGYKEEADGIEKLKNKYDEISAKQEDSTETGENLQKVIDELVNKYGLSEEALKSESTTRQDALKYLDEEILKRQRLAAEKSKQSIDTGNMQFQIEDDREMLEMSEELADKNKKLRETYDLTGDTLVELMGKYTSAISTLSAKSDKTKQEEKDLKKLTETYNNLDTIMTKFKDGYQDTLEVLASGHKITTEDTRVLENLGLISEDIADDVELMNSLSEEAQEKAWASAENQQHFIDALKDSDTALEEYSEALSAAEDAASQYQSALDNNIDTMINYSDHMDLLKTAEEELANTGSITAETFKSLSDNNLLQYLEVVNGQLTVNTQAFANSTEAIKQNALENLQATTYEQIRTVVLADLQSQETATGDAATAAGTAMQNSGQNAIDMGAKMLEASGDVAALNAQLAAMPGVTGDYTPSSDASQKIQDILNQAQKTKSFIESWKPSSSKAATSGGGRKSSGGSSKKSSGGSSSKSAKEEYKAEIDALYWYKNALDNAEESVDKLNDALKNTDNFNEQEKYLNQLIEATNNQINKTNDLKNAQVGQINDYINQLRAQGFAIDYSADKNELYINNMQHLADFSGDTAKNLEKLIDKIQDLNDDNRDLDGSIRDLTADVKDYYDQLAEIPEKKLEKFNDLMEEFQQSRLDQVQYQIEDLEHEMKNDPRLKALEEQIAALEKQNDEIDKQQEMEEKLLAVEEAKLKLQNAQQQKTLQVYREGQGFVWEADPDAIKEAQEELEDAQKDLNEQIKDDQLEQLEEEKEAIEKSYQDRIDALQNFLDEQEYLIDKANREGIQTFEELRNELAKYGLDSAEYLGKATDWLNNYNSALANLNNTVQGILASSGDATSELIYSSAMQSRINQALSNALPEVATNSSMFGSGINYDKVSSSSSQTVYINTVELPNVQDSEDFISELKNLPRMATSQSALRQ